MLTPDFDTYPITHSARSLVVLHSGRCLQITWDDGKKDQYHAFTLRENATDEQTIHPITREQALMLEDIDKNLTITAAEITNNGIAIQWSDNTQHTYHLGWLRAWRDANFFALPQRELWSDNFTPHYAEHNQITNDLNARLVWLENFYKHGVAIVKNCPENQNIAELIGVIRDSNFGKFFDVELKLERADSNAYTSLPLPLHVDLATREYQPGLQFLHCLHNSTDGGLSTLADGFKIAGIVKKNHPEIYKILTTIPWPLYNKAETTDYRCARPLIETDSNGNPTEIRYTPWLRAPLQYDFKTSEQLYDALRTLANTIENTENNTARIAFKLNDGETLCFDNRRTLHGRTGFSAKHGKRHLRGCYVEHEELDSAIRITKRNIRKINAQQ